MIELAPHSKVGLPLTSPVMIAAGCGGYGDIYQALLDLSAFGAVVTNPITLRPRRGPSQPRVVETPAGFILNTGGQNPGVKKILQQYGPVWRRLGLPVIAHLPADELEDLQRTARALGETESTLVGGAIAAIELGLPWGASLGDVERWIEAVRAGCLLPLLVKLPLDDADRLAGLAVTTPIDLLVIGSPPQGAAIVAGTGETVRGDLYGPALHSLALQQLHRLKEVADLPLVAAGGVHSAADVRTFLAAGAIAVQLDSLLFIDPPSAFNVAQAFKESHPA